MNPTQPIDPVSVFVALLTSSGVGAAVANGLAAYAVIILAASFGAGWALSRREPDKRGNPTLFVALIAGTATMVTAGLAELANKYLGLSSINWLLAPIALVIGGIGHEWPVLLKWAGSRLMRVFERRNAA